MRNYSKNNSIYLGITNHCIGHTHTIVNYEHTQRGPGKKKVLKEKRKRGSVWGIGRIYVSCFDTKFIDLGGFGRSWHQLFDGGVSGPVAWKDNLVWIVSVLKNVKDNLCYRNLYIQVSHGEYRCV